MYTYVVFIDSGEYDSWERIVVRAYSDEQKAKKYVDRKNKQLQIFKKYSNKFLRRFFEIKRLHNLRYLNNINGYEFEEVRVW